MICIKKFFIFSASIIFILGIVLIYTSTKTNNDPQVIIDNNELQIEVNGNTTTLNSISHIENKNDITELSKLVNPLVNPESLSVIHTNIDNTKLLLKYNNLNFTSVGISVYKDKLPISVPNTFNEINLPKEIGNYIIDFSLIKDKSEMIQFCFVVTVE